MSKYLDKSGLSYLWQKILDRLGQKVDKDGNKGLSTNDFDDEAKQKLAGLQNYEPANESAPGLMSAEDKKKLDAIAENANEYVLPEATGSVLGGVRTGSGITNDGGTISVPVMQPASASGNGATGTVPAPTAGTEGKFLRGDGVWADPPGQDYDDASQSESGLMSANDKKKLDAFGPATDYALKSDISIEAIGTDEIDEVVNG